MQEPIAIIGIGCRFPGRANTPAAFWRLLVDGVDAIREVPPERYDLGQVFDADPSVPGRMYTRWGGFVDGIDQFDAGFFGFSPREALRIDPQHRMLLEVAWEALEDAGTPPDRLAGSQTGVFVGISTHDYPDFQAYPANRALIDAHTNSGGAGSIAANRISYVYDLRGPSFIVDTACSSSLVAVHLACASLRSGECDLALAGGVQAVLAPELTIGFCKASMISPDGRCKAFSAEANGYVRGEGAGMIVLKPLSRALADNDPIYAIVRGSAINEDGRTNGMTVPGLDAQQQVLRDAYRRAGVQPGDVHYIEAHGPGTPVGDPIEAEALATVLACERPAGEVLRIGSVKTNIGHLEAASGIAGLIKAALVVRHRQIPPSLHFRTPNPAIPFEQYRLRVAADAEMWPDNTPVLTGINSFGFGGANAHVVLEGPPARAHSAAIPAGTPPAPRAELLVTSARSADSLRGLARAYRDLALGNQTLALSDLAAAAAHHRTHHDHRLGIVGRDLETIADHLDAFLNGETRADVIAGRAAHGRAPRLAFVFAGMGPQWYGMGRQLLDHEPVFRRVIEECDSLIRRHATWSLVDELRADESRSRVSEADFAQPVNFAFQAALLAVWKSWGIEPAAVVGHSAGEIAALYATGAMDLGESVRVAFYRGQLQHRASGKGRMLAVGQSLDAVQPLLAEYTGRIAVAAINSPSSVTLSGDSDAIADLAARLESQRTFCRVMAVQVPYHSHHMDPIERDLLDALAGLRLTAGHVPIVSEVTGEWTSGDRFDAAYWWRNIRQPVRFMDAILRLARDGYDTFVEVSPHPVLASSVTECLAHAGTPGVCFGSLRRMDDDRAMLLRTAAGLYTRGVEVDWDQIEGRPRTGVPLPLYAWNKERVWLDAAPAAATADIRSKGDDTRILGGRMPTVQPLWEVDLNSPALSYLQDHRIHGAIVFPGAGYVAMALEAASELGRGANPAIEGIEFRKALFVPDSGALRMQAVFDPETRAVRIHAENGASDSNGGWTLHSACRVAASPTPDAGAIDLDAIRQRCTRAMTHDEFYREVQQRGFTFGPRFMGLDALTQGDGEALGYVRLPDAHQVEVNGCRVHPALFDAGLQVLIAAVMSREQPREGRWPAFLPTHASRVVSHQPTGRTFWSHALVTTVTPEGFEGSVTLYDEDGRTLLQVEGLRAKTLEEITRSGDSGSAADCLYQLVWEEQPPLAAAAQGGSRDTSWCAPAHAAETVNRTADQLSRELGFAGYYRDVEPKLERIARAFFAAALKDLGIDLRPGSTFRVDRFPDGRVPSPRRLRQFGAVVAALAETGALAVRGDLAHVVNNTAVDDPLALIEELRAERPAYGSVLDVVSRCGLALADVLTGTRGAPEVLFSGDGAAVMATFYRDAPSCRLFNALTAESVAAAVAGFPADRDVRVLEVGAGTGATTRHVLPRLPQSRMKFVFTDISPLFVNVAREEIGESPSIDYAQLDIERDVRSQGFEPASFDIVIAANVVHATGDVARTLAHLRSLLKADGLLVLQEITRRPRWLDLVFGITDGWWAFGDRELRPDHALLDVAIWQRVLVEAGFEEPSAVCEGEDSVPGQSILLARAPLTAAPRDAADTWLVLADRRGLGERVAAGLRQKGHAAVVAFGGDRFSRISESAYELPPGTPAAMQQLLRGIAVQGRALTGVVHLWSLDMPAVTDAVPAGSFLSAQPYGYGSMLDLLHAVQAAGHTHLKRTVLVTAGAQAIDERTDHVAVAQAPLWGFGRILLHEHPELRPVLVDLGTGADAGDADAVVSEAIAETREDEIALRAAHRYVRRLVRLDPDARTQEDAPPEPANGRAFRVDVDAAGSLESLTLREFPRRSLARDEIEIDVRAASLNFRDVMFAMGMLPPAAFENSLSAGAMGVDCAGVVSRVGDAVTDIKPGDEVVALAPASLASHAFTKELVVRKPAGLSFAEAAALPLAYVTAIYSLQTVARLQRGERVLIHAATGGVGLAALAVAEKIGAEIFATAGTDAKRDYLKARGVRHVMDSRSLDFADEIMRQTGGRGVDVVLNSLPGEAIAKGLSVLAPRGRFLEIGKADIYRNGELPLEAFSRNLSFFAIQVDLLCDGDRRVLRDAMRTMVEGIEDGTLAPLVTQSFSIGALQDGLRTLAQARHIGKVVIAFDDPAVPIRSAAGEVPAFREDATYLITGGVGGVGTALARWAFTRGARHFALMSRNAQAGESADAIAFLREQGAEVQLLSGDVSQLDEVERAVAAADRPSAPLKGIFHGAMVIDDAPLSELDAARFDRVMAPKACGAWNLHLATRGRALDHFVMFSSITSVYGNGRQGNYAAANAFLDAFAGYRRAQGLPGLTVNWGVFSDVGYVSTRKELGEFLARQGQYGLAANQGFAAMESLMRHGVVQATISRTDWPVWAESNPVMGASPRFRSLVQARTVAEPEKARSSARVLDKLLERPESERREELSQHLRRRVARILGSSPDRVEPGVPLTDMGMDSLMAVELMTVVKNDLTIDIPAVKLLQGVTLNQLADKILEQIAATSPSVEAGPVSAPADAPVASPLDVQRVFRPAESNVGPPASSDDVSIPQATVLRSADVIPATPETAAAAYSRLPYARWTPFQRFARFVVTGAIRGVADVSIEGAHHVPASGPVVIAANHLSMWDAPVLLNMTERRTVMFAAEELRRLPWMHWSLHKLWDAIYLKRGEGDTEAIERALGVLQGGGMLGLAPEGSRSRNGLGRGLTGVAHLAYRSGAPILPVAVFGQERIPDECRRLKRARVTVRVGTPIPAPQGDPSAHALRALTDRVMLEIARMLPVEYRGIYADAVDDEETNHLEIA